MKVSEFLIDSNFLSKLFTFIYTDVIETVLRSNQGAVDATIDQLLQISSETPTTNAPANVSA